MTRLAGGRIIGTERTVSITTRGEFINSLDADPSDDSDVPGINVAGLVVAPGLIDIQINGAHGFDFTSDPASIWRVGARLPEHGVSAFLPTIITSPPEAIDAARAAI